MRGLGLLARQVKQARVKVEILAHRQLGIERERLRHIADALARIEIAGVDRLAEQQRFARASAATSPVSIFIVVVLPQPFEPRKPKISPRSMVKLT